MFFQCPGNRAHLLSYTAYRSYLSYTSETGFPTGWS